MYIQYNMQRIGAKEKEVSTFWTTIDEILPSLHLMMTVIKLRFLRKKVPKFSNKFVDSFQITFIQTQNNFFQWK